MYPYLGNGGSLHEGQECLINILGHCEPKRLYGYVDGVLVILYTPGGSLGYELSRFGIGTSVKGIISNITKRGVFAEVKERCGTFNGQETIVEVTEQSYLDARDSFSTTKDGAGLFGVAAIVKRYKPKSGYDPQVHHRCHVRIKDIVKGKKWKPRILTNMLDEGLERDVIRELYVLEWPPDMRYPSPYSKPTGRKLPKFSAMKDWRIGIPADIKKALFFGNKNTMILDEDGDHRRISGSNPVEAVSEFYDKLGGDNFKLGLATPERIDEMRKVIVELGLFAEDLAIKK